MSKVDLVVRGGTVVDGSGGALFEADVAIDAGKIVAIGQVAQTGHEEIDARGLVVTPGFIDVHTHYDGQLTWAEQLSPSSSHGVTTVVAGNCGVGFAPCREADRDSLMRLMEGVEDIPAATMAEGLPWDWESFPDFLDSLERRHHDIDFAILLPHSPLRVYVMGQRAIDLEPATDEDLAIMRALTRDAAKAGAIGFGTSRNIVHKARDGTPIPSLAADEEELREIALGLSDAGRGVLQAITVHGTPTVADYEMFRRVSQASGRPISFSLLQPHTEAEPWREVLALMDRDKSGDADMKAQVFNRAVGVILGLDVTMNPFSGHAFFTEHLAHLPLAQRVAEMHRPETRARLLEPGSISNAPEGASFLRYDKMFLMDALPDYEPEDSASIAAIAAARGAPPLEILYDMLLADEGRAMLMCTATNYRDGNLDTVLELLRRDDTVMALGDGGAHCGMICDSSYSTFALTHWVRDRKRGERLTLPEVVQMLTDEPARLHRFHDRGRLEVGLKGDLNIIDMDRLALHVPTVIHDLPGGGKRLVQTAEGYRATVVAGTPIQVNGKDTGSRPGRLVRNAGI